MLIHIQNKLINLKSLIHLTFRNKLMRKKRMMKIFKVIINLKKKINFHKIVIIIIK